MTTGGWRGMNGAQRRVALLAGIGFAVILLLVLVANAESQISDLAASGAHIPDHLVWSWEWTSVVAWVSLCPALWWVVGRVRPPRFGWPSVTAALAIGSVAAWGWHVGVMVALRHAYYAATGAGPYRFFGVIGNRLAYEYRKDLVTYAQFVVLAAAIQWLIARAATVPPADAGATTPGPDAAPTLTVTDGATRYAVPVLEIESVTAAGNYVELCWGERTLLHRSTLGAMETELGDAFVRIHRGALVRRDALRSVAVDRTGDFVATLATGRQVRGSRRFRAGVEGMLA